ncbi:MAG: tRNA 4-thiouridine(8) synthase ThiI [Candidatus Omnitrophota bacterium]
MPKRAVVLISGGLDSALAAKVINLQGVEVFGLAFITPFMHPRIEELGQNMGIQIRTIDVSSEYLDIIKNPRFGFGKNLNPCIDCHIFMLKKAKEIMPEYKADFVISGEVLGQWPMSQNRAALKKIEAESGLAGLLLRPLSALLLSKTIPEQEGWVERDRLLGFSGRSRKPQMELVNQLGLKGFSQPAGGCLLTDAGFSKRLRDLMIYQREFNLDDVRLLKTGRHFRLSAQAKLILGRNREENQRLLESVSAGDFFLQPKDVSGPSGILKTRVISQELLELSSGILGRYCDRSNGRIYVSIEGNKENQVIHCPALEPQEVDMLRI